MEFTIRQYGHFSEDVYFEVPDEVVKRKLQEYKDKGYDYDEAKDALEDYICSNRWDFHTDYGDRDDDVDDWDFQDDLYEGIEEMMGDYEDEEEYDDYVGEL